MITHLHVYMYMYITSTVQTNHFELKMTVNVKFCNLGLIMMKF